MPNDFVLPEPAAAVKEQQESATQRPEDVIPQDDGLRSAFEQMLAHPQDKVVSPLVDAFQQHIGAPLVDQYVRNSGVAASPALEAITRDATELVTGQSADKAMSAEDFYKAQKQMGGTGSIPAAALETAASMAPDLAMQAVMPAADLKLATEIPEAARALGITAEATPRLAKLVAQTGKMADLAAIGAQQGAGVALVKKEDVGQGATQGAAFNVGVHVAPRVLGEVLGHLGGAAKTFALDGLRGVGKKARILAEHSGEEMQGLFQELKSLVVPEGAKLPPAASPTVAIIDTNDAGQPVAKVFALGKKVASQEFPLTSATAVEDFARLRNQHGLQVYSDNPKFYGQTDEWKQQVFGPRRAGGPLKDSLDNLSPNEPHLALDVDGKVKFVPTQRPATDAMLPGDPVRVYNADGTSWTGEFARATKDGKVEVEHTPVLTPRPQFKDAAAGLQNVGKKRIVVAVHQVAPEMQPGDFVESFRDKTGNKFDPSMEMTRPGMPGGLDEVSRTTAEDTGTIKNPDETASKSATPTQQDGEFTKFGRAKGEVEDALGGDAAARAKSAMASLNNPEATQRTGHGASLSTGADEGKFTPPGSSGSPAPADAKTVPPVNDLVPPKLPPQAQPLPGELPPVLEESLKTVNALDLLQKSLDSRAGKGQSVFTKARSAWNRFAVSPVVDTMNAPFLRAQFSAIEAAPRLEKSVTNDLVKAIHAAAGKEWTPGNDFDKAVGDWQARPSPEKLALLDTFPQFQKMKELVVSLGDRLKLNSQLLTEHGLVDPMNEFLRKDGSLEEYAARLYWGKILPRDRWAQYAKSQGLLNKFADEIRDSMQKAGEKPDERQIFGTLHDLLFGDAPNPIENLKSSPSPVGRAAKNLLARQTLTPGVKEALGILDNGLYPMAVSLGKQEALVSKARAFDNISRDPAYFSNQPVPGWVHLTNGGPERYGKLAGGWVPPHVASGVEGASRAIEKPGIFSGAMNWMRSMLISPLYAGLGPINHHAMGQVFNSTLAGGLDVTRPLESVAALNTARRALREYGQNPLGSGPAELVREAMKKGVPLQGWGSEALDSVKSTMLRTMEGEMAKAPSGEDFWNHTDRLYDSLKKGAQKTGTALQGLQHGQANAYDYFANSIFQVANYISLRQKFLRAAQAIQDGSKFHALLHPELAQTLEDTGGNVLESARTLAAMRVRMSIANPSNITPSLRGAARTAESYSPVMASPILEQARIIGNATRRIATGQDPDLAARVFATSVALGGPLLAARHWLMSHNGITEQDIRNAQATRTASDENWHPITVGLPWRDKEGRIQLMDATHYIPLAQLLRGSPIDNPFIKAGTNLLTPGMPQDAAPRKFLESAGLLQQEDYKLQEKNIGAGAAALQASRTGLLPSIYAKVHDAAEQSGSFGMTPNPNKPQLTGAQAIVNGLGIGHVSPVDTSSSTRAIKEVNYHVNDLKRQLNKARVAGDADTMARIQAKVNFWATRAQKIRAAAGIGDEEAGN